MTALTDIQKALNTIRRITQQEVEAVRLEALALMAGVIADEAKDIEKRREPKPQRTAPQEDKVSSHPLSCTTADTARKVTAHTTNSARSARLCTAEIHSAAVTSPKV